MQQSSGPVVLVLFFCSKSCKVFGNGRNFSGIYTTFLYSLRSFRLTFIIKPWTLFLAINPQFLLAIKPNSIYPDEFMRWSELTISSQTVAHSALLWCDVQFWGLAEKFKFASIPPSAQPGRPAENYNGCRPGIREFLHCTPLTKVWHTRLPCWHPAPQHIIEKPTRRPGGRGRRPRQRGQPGAGQVQREHGDNATLFLMILCYLSRCF